MRNLFATALAVLLVDPVVGQDGVTGEGFEFDGDDVTVPFSPTPAAPTPLWRYVFDGNAMGVEALLAAGAAAHLEVRNDAGQTPLTYTTTSGRIRILNALLGAGADSSAADPNGVPPLILAARIGHIEPLRALVDNGVDTEVLDFNNLSGLWHATRQGSYAMVELLLDAGATTEHRDHQNYAPLSWATMQGRADIMELLLSRGADAGIVNEYVMDRLFASEAGCIIEPQYDAVAQGCPSAFTGVTLRDYARLDMIQRLDDALASRRLSGTARSKAGA